MRIFNLSLDQSLLNNASAAAKRAVDYGELTERYLILVPNRHDVRHALSERVEVIGVGGRNKAVIWWRLFRLGRKIFTHNHFDLVTVTDAYFLALVAYFLARKFNLPLQIQVHGFERFYGLRKKLAKWLLPRAAGARAVSERLRRQLVADFGVSPERISVIPIYSEFNCDAIGGKIVKSPGEFIFLTVARLVTVKNIGAQLLALAKLRQAHAEAKLWIVGAGPERWRLEKQAADLGLGTAVKFWGRRDDLADFYRVADVFVLSSESEGWGLSVIEAGTCGLPVVMTDVGCAGEVVVNGESGLVAPVGDQAALTEALQTILADQNLRNSLSAGLRLAARKLPTKAETLKRCADDWQKLISHHVIH